MGGPNIDSTIMVILIIGASASRPEFVWKPSCIPILKHGSSTFQHWNPLGELFLGILDSHMYLEVQCVNVEIQEPKILRDFFLASWTLILKLNASISQYIIIQEIYIIYLHTI